MNPIKISSPTRVDLAGGTLDMWPLYMVVGSAKTVNVAINIFTHAELILTSDRSIEVESKDLGKKKFYVDYASFIQDTDPAFHFYRVAIDYFKPVFGFKLMTSSESPVGGGLGGSSSLMVSVLKAFAKACLTPFKSTNELAHVAHNLEAKILVTPTGTQDYYPAITGGLSILDYTADGIQQKISDLKIAELTQRFLLVYTGKSHHSGLNNFEVLKNTVEKNPRTIRALAAIKQISEEMVHFVTQGSWSELTPLFQREFQSRLALAESFASPEILQLEKIALGAGGLAIKICGAGGGGCVLLWCEPVTKQKVAEAVEKAGFQVLKAEPVSHHYVEKVIKGQV